MKYLLILLALLSTPHAYNIGGAYGMLVKCEYGQYGYEYGYIGTYKVNGSMYKIYFGQNYCPH